MYFADYVPTEQERVIEETRQRLAQDASAKFQRVLSIDESIALLQELRVDAIADAEQANKRYANYLNDNGLNGACLEVSVQE